MTTNGKVILKCTNAAAITVTLGTPASLGASVGDSLNIRQGGAGALTITGFIDGGTTKTTSLLNETKTFIADSSGTWIYIGG